jgi:hypothetical protein
LARKKAPKSKKAATTPVPIKISCKTEAFTIYPN